MVTIQQGKFRPIKFSAMLDPKTGRTRVRMVDIDTESYKIARRYMIRLGPTDLADPLWLQALAEAGKTTAADLRARFGG